MTTTVSTLTNVQAYKAIGPMFSGYLSAPATVPYPRQATVISGGGYFVSPASLSPWQIDAIKTINRLEQLPNNWSSYNYPAPDKSVCGWARDLISTMQLGALGPPEFFPGSDGSIQIEWSGTNKELELHLNPDRAITYLKLENGQPIEEDVISALDRRAAESLIAWLR